MGGSGRTCVLIADDHPLFRGAIARVVEDHPAFELVAEATDGRAALERIRELEPDVAVIDVRMPALHGSDVLVALREEGLRTNVVFLSAFLDAKTVYDAVAAGANAYLSKEADGGEIVAAIEAAARDETILGPEVQTGLAEQIRAREESDFRPRLSSTRSWACPNAPRRSQRGCAVAWSSSPIGGAGSVSASSPAGTRGRRW